MYTEKPECARHCSQSPLLNIQVSAPCTHARVCCAYHAALLTRCVMPQRRRPHLSAPPDKCCLPICNIFCENRDRMLPAYQDSESVSDKLGASEQQRSKSELKPAASSSSQKKSPKQSFVTSTHDESKSSPTAARKELHIPVYQSVVNDDNVQREKMQYVPLYIPEQAVNEALLSEAKERFNKVVSSSVASTSDESEEMREKRRQRRKTKGQPQATHRRKTHFANRRESAPYKPMAPKNVLTPEYSSSQTNSSPSSSPTEQKRKSKKSLRPRSQSAYARRKTLAPPAPDYPRLSMPYLLPSMVAMPPVLNQAPLLLNPVPQHDQHNEAMEQQPHRSQEIETEANKQTGSVQSPTISQTKGSKTMDAMLPSQQPVMIPNHQQFYLPASTVMMSNQPRASIYDGPVISCMMPSQLFLNQPVPPETTLTDSYDSDESSKQEKSAEELYKKNRRKSKRHSVAKKRSSRRSC